MSALSTGRGSAANSQQEQIVAFASAIRSEVLRRLVMRRQRIRGARGACRHAISLIEVRRDPLRSYFRLDGTKQVELFGIDCTCRYLHEAMSAGHAAMAGASALSPTPKRPMEYEIVILPFSSDGEQVDLLMTGIVPDQTL